MGDDEKLGTRLGQLNGALSVQSMMLRHQYVKQTQRLEHTEIHTALPLTSVSHTPFHEYEQVFKGILEKSPNQAIAIPPVPRRDLVKHVGILRRVNKTENSYTAKPFYIVWRIVNNVWIKHTVTALLVLSMAISITLSMADESASPVAFDVLRNIEMALNVLFLIEIICQFVARGKKADICFYVDLCLVILTMVSPGFVILCCTATGQDIESVAQKSGRVLWILGALKGFRIIPRVASLRHVFMSIWSVKFTFFLLIVMIFMMMYVFAVMGMYVFYDYTKADNPDFEYQYKFATLGNALVTMFQIITYDCWLGITLEVASVINPWFAYPYFILWVWLGAFIFANVFTAILVNTSKAASEQEQKRKARREEMQRQVMEKKKYLDKQRKKAESEVAAKFDSTLQVRGRDLAVKVRDIYSMFLMFCPSDRKDAKVGTDDASARNMVIKYLQMMGNVEDYEWTEESYRTYFRRLAELSNSLKFTDEIDKLMAQLIFQALEGSAPTFLEHGSNNGGDADA